LYFILSFYKYIGKHQATKPNYKRNKEIEGSSSFPLAREEEMKEDEETGMLSE
jgi:hypothetical protein